MKFVLIKERKSPPDRRVVFSPETAELFVKKYPNVQLVLETSDIRVFKDEEYQTKGITVSDNVDNGDVFMGVKEIPVENLLANKKYFFFSHTIKKQPYNRKLLIACLQKNITLFDHETVVDINNDRLIGFGRYAGIVGAYNGIRAFGLKFEMFQLPKAETLNNQEALITQLKKIILPNIKIVLTGKGKVAMGAKEMLDAMKIKLVTVEDYLSKTYTYPVYCQINVEDYNKYPDNLAFNKTDFYANPQKFVSNFERFSEVSDVFMAGHFYGNNAPVILSQNMLQSAKCKLKVVADISCDVDGPIACTLKASTIAEPIYGYLPSTHQIVDAFHPGAIVVMAVDNLPCELPRDASEGFGEVFINKVIPAFFNDDADGILERAKITENGKLTTRFAYLQNYVDGIE